jgi:hypothetical protein
VYCRPAGNTLGALYHKLLKMGKMVARNIVELIGIINKLLLLRLVGYFYYSF